MSEVKKSQERVTVENLIDGSIIEGFQSANAMFLESLEDSLQKHVIITEAGDAHSVLQQMLDENIQEKVEEEANVELGTLTEKLSRVLA